MNKNITLFCDIDGTLIEHVNTATGQCLNKTPKLLPNTLDAINFWNSNGYTIILTTARKESMRDITIKQLEQLGIIYDKLILGIDNIRVVVNDCKSNSRTAYAINLVRNHGLEYYDITKTNPELLKETDNIKILANTPNYIIRHIILNQDDEIKEVLDIRDKSCFITKGSIYLHIYGSESELTSFRDSNENLDSQDNIILKSKNENELTIMIKKETIINLQPLTKYKIHAIEDSEYIETQSV
jgi:hydroxymethylpyrimidine pyrophosphatase-like HAD family hydrolase